MTSVVYETGASSGVIDLLNKLTAFAATNGWGTGGLSDGAKTFSKAYGGKNIRAAVKVNPDPVPGPIIQWDTRGLISINAGVDIDSQVNAAPHKHTMDLGPGPYSAYHFYSGDEEGSPYLHATIEVTAGIFRHWVLGAVVPYGTVTPGVYTDSTYLADDDINRNIVENGQHHYVCDALSNIFGAALWVDYDARANNWQEIIQDAISLNTALGAYRQAGILQSLMDMGPQQYNLRTPIYPLEYFVNRAASLRTSIGRMPNFGAVSMANFSPGQVVDYGTENWQVFPVFARQAGPVGTSFVSSGFYGYAHRR